MKCVLYDCLSYLCDRNCLYTFPSASSPYYDGWINFMNFFKEHEQPSTTSLLCKAHFTPSDFYNYRQYMTGEDKILIMKKYAVPSIPSADLLKSMASLKVVSLSLINEDYNILHIFGVDLTVNNPELLNNDPSQGLVIS